MSRKSIYTKQIIDFMRRCEDENMTIDQAMRQCSINFCEEFKIGCFRYQAKKHGIVFASPNMPPINQLDPRIIKLIQKYKHLEIYELRDEIIIRFEEDIKLSILKGIINYLEIKKNAK